MSMILKLRQAKLDAAQAMQKAVNDAAAFEAAEAAFNDACAQLERAEKAERAMAGQARPLDGNTGDDAALAPIERSIYSIPRPNLTRSADGNYQAGNAFDGHLAAIRSGLNFKVEQGKHFRTFGEQLQAIHQAAITRGQVQDPRLNWVNNDFTKTRAGAVEYDPTGGGFLVQTDFAATVFTLSHDMGQILSRVNKIQISANANGIKIPGIDETSRATGSRWGGVQSFWQAEGAQPTDTKPKFRMLEFDLKKLMSLMYMTDELLSDTTALTSIAAQAFSEEIMFMTEDAVFEGTGAGQPLGMINAPALVQVAKEKGQPAGTILTENIDNMWSRMWSRSRMNAVWYINQDCEPQLNQLVRTAGTGGQPVYLPPGGISQSPYGLLYGRPVIATEYNAALGSVGDILLADPSMYLLADKNGVQAATSMHVAFLTDQQVFRITYRVDGKPMVTSAITPFKGSNTRSPFVALAAR